MLKAVFTGLFIIGLAGSACAAQTGDGKADIVLNGTVASLTGQSSSGPVPKVKPGEQLTITGDCVANLKSADRLRVMLTLAGDTDAGTGYHVLATDQTIGSDGLNVRVPDLPETSNRDFNVRVFRLGEDTPQICNAGTIHVRAASKHHLG